MELYYLGKELVFPDVSSSISDVIAIGGDLSVERLLKAYQDGFFPWYSKGEPITWWSPKIRLILELDQFRLSKSLKRVLRQKKFSVTFDTQFKNVICSCAKIPRKDQEDTWIISDMISAYKRLHEKGYAHSVEVCLNEELVGGLYGISMGRCFFGESMFSKVSDASKVAFAYLVQLMKYWKYDFIDCQVSTNHLKSLGAIEIQRITFLNLLDKALQGNSKVGFWDSYIQEPCFIW